ncbi:hypothetical protein [Streptomyces sp. NPDC058401]
MDSTAHRSPAGRHHLYESTREGRTTVARALELDNYIGDETSTRQA